MNKIFIKGLVILSIVSLLGAFSCAQGVSQAQYDNVKSQLSQTQGQLSQTQNQLKALQDKAAPVVSDNLSAALSKINEDLKRQNDYYAAQITALDGQKKAADASLQDLNAKYTDLQKQYAALSKPPDVITEGAVEQAIFTLINQERTSNNVNALLWGNNLYTITRQNSAHMAETGRYEYSTWGFYQQIFQAAAYGAVDGIARGAVQVWKINQYQFEHGILSKAFKYGAIGVYKQGDVVFITFMAADVP